MFALALILLLIAPAHAAPAKCAEWMEANEYVKGWAYTTPKVTASSPTPGSYEANIKTPAYLLYTEPTEIQALTFRVSWPYQTFYHQRLTVYSGISYHGEATVKLTGLAPGQYETVASSVYALQYFGGGINWIPGAIIPVPASSFPEGCISDGGVGGASVQ